MDDVKDQIKQKVLLLDESLEDNYYLDLMVENVTNRALVYMNRETLIAQFEDTEIEEADKIYPIPLILYTPLAMTIYQVIKQSNALIENTTGTGGINSIKDNGQSIDYNEKAFNYLNNQKDGDIFTAITDLLQNYRLIKTYDNDNFSEV